MHRLFRSVLLTALTVATVGAVAQPVSAAKPPLLYGTTGACNNVVPGGPCTQTSTLVQLDPTTGALVRVVGPVGFTVNGLAFDQKTQVMYASTAIGDVAFHGLIRIDLATGAGTPVNTNAPNFALAGPESPIHSITINNGQKMVGWYDEFGAGVTDTFVKIDETTGIATEFPNTGIDTSANGLSFDVDNNLWNIDTARRNGTVQTQKAYLINQKNGKPLATVALTPPTMAALGDFNPANNLYYGLNFDPSSPTTFVEVVNVAAGTVTPLGQTADGLHTLAFIKKLK